MITRYERHVPLPVRSLMSRRSFALNRKTQRRWCSSSPLERTVTAHPPPTT